VIEVRVGQVDVVDQRELGERKVADTRARVDQHIVIDEEGRGAQMAAANATAASEYAQPHAWSMSPGAISS